MPIRCSVCSQGTLSPKLVARYDVGGLIGLHRVVLEDSTLSVCDRCGAVSVPGEVLERVMDGLAAFMAQRVPELAPAEARYLRKYLGATQEELSRRLGVHRTTVARWEVGEGPVPRDGSTALRALAALHLAGKDPSRARELERAFVDPPDEAPPRPYVLAPTGT